MEHDHAYKLHFSYPELVADRLRELVREPWVEALDITTVDRVSASFVSADLRSRESDIIWRVRTAEGWLYVYLLIELQSTVDRYRTVRLLVYVGLLYQDLIARGEGLSAGRLPPVVPIVLYNGERPWTAARELAELIAPGPAGGGLERYRPQLRYLLLDEGRYSEAELASLESLLAAVFRLEGSAGSAPLARALALALRTLREPRYAEREGVDPGLARGRHGARPEAGPEAGPGRGPRAGSGRRAADAAAPHRAPLRRHHRRGGRATARAHRPPRALRAGRRVGHRLRAGRGASGPDPRPGALEGAAKHQGLAARPRRGHSARWAAAREPGFSGQVLLEGLEGRKRDRRQTDGILHAAGLAAAPLPARDGRGRWSPVDDGVTSAVTVSAAPRRDPETPSRAGGSR